MKIIISRTDNLGDVALTLPLAGFLKERFPEATIYFVGKGYTQPLIQCCQAVDYFLDKAALVANPASLQAIQADAIVFVFPDKEMARLAHQAKIPLRIGTSHRWWHWWYANRLVNFSRKKSDLHEAQLNFKLLQPLGIQEIPALPALPRWYHFKAPDLPAEIAEWLSPTKKNVILHPKSKGSGREWHLDKYYQLAAQNPQYQFFITGVEQEGAWIHAQKPEIFTLPHVRDCTGKLDLQQLIALIARADALVASGTGPVHIAAALGIRTIGIFPPIKPIHPARWQPIGTDAHVLVLDKKCQDCRKTLPCLCVEAIEVSAVEALLQSA